VGADGFEQSHFIVVAQCFRRNAAEFGKVSDTGHTPSNGKRVKDVYKELTGRVACSSESHLPCKQALNLFELKVSHQG
jgi:putative intracellular protease/amidase